MLKKYEPIGLSFTGENYESSLDFLSTLFLPRKKCTTKKQKQPNEPVNSNSI